MGGLQTHTKDGPYCPLVPKNWNCDPTKIEVRIIPFRSGPSWRYFGALWFLVELYNSVSKFASGLPIALMTNVAHAQPFQEAFLFNFNFFPLQFTLLKMQFPQT